MLGDPIEHSRSPALHRAAYAALGLDWSYEARRVPAGGFADFWSSVDDSWGGFSVTMPLKREILDHLDTRTALVDTVEAANTICIGSDGVRGYNTDVAGIVGALADHGVDSLSQVQLLGAGATAASVLAAAASLGASSVTVAVRQPDRAAGLRPLAERLGLALAVTTLHEPADGATDAVISALPGGTFVPDIFPVGVRERAVLLDVAYDPWPSELARRWSELGGRVASGLEMLLHQAVIQVRVFLGGDERELLPDEDRVIAAMRASVGL